MRWRNASIGSARRTQSNETALELARKLLLWFALFLLLILAAVGLMCFDEILNF